MILVLVRMLLRMFLLLLLAPSVVVAGARRCYPATDLYSYYFCFYVTTTVYLDLLLLFSDQ
jgi:hypothetical protein